MVYKFCLLLLFPYLFFFLLLFNFLFALFHFRFNVEFVRKQKNKGKYWKFLHAFYLHRQSIFSCLAKVILGNIERFVVENKWGQRRRGGGEEKQRTENAKLTKRLVPNGVEKEDKFNDKGTVYFEFSILCLESGLFHCSRIRKFPKFPKNTFKISKPFKNFPHAAV